MSNNTVAQTFSPAPPQAGVLSWIHIGDLHMLRPGDQNDLDLQTIVARINTLFAASISFVYLPGDVAEHGDPAAYALVRRSLDQLTVPWCSILGDHDVHEQTFAPYLEAMASSLYYAFTAGNTRFCALSAFDVPHPASFILSSEQLEWLTLQLEQATAHQQSIILFLHCYPSDLKSGASQLADLIRKHRVLLVAMGHTHYNEIANDGHTLYTSTRSTGQIEEGPVGFSITSLDHGIVSWRFVELAQLDRQPTVILTSPADQRLTTSQTPTVDASSAQPLHIRARIWSASPITAVHAHLAGHDFPLEPIPGTQLWQARLDPRTSPDYSQIPFGLHQLHVTAQDQQGRVGEDLIHFDHGNTLPAAPRAPRDQDNFVAAWPEHGLLATQLGPNKNGRKW